MSSISLVRAKDNLINRYFVVVSSFIHVHGFLVASFIIQYLCLFNKPIILVPKCGIILSHQQMYFIKSKFFLLCVWYFSYCDAASSLLFHMGQYYVCSSLIYENINMSVQITMLKLKFFY